MYSLSTPIPRPGDTISDIEASDISGYVDPVWNATHAFAALQKSQPDSISKPESAAEIESLLEFGSQLKTSDFNLAAWHMAVDEALLDRVDTWIRVTYWSAPAVTLGRFQRWRTVLTELANPPRPSPDQPPTGESASFTRRVTGGGAIFHGRDVTLTVAVARDRLSSENYFDLREVAESVAERLRTSLELIGCPNLALRGGANDERSQLELPDCFERASPFDLVDSRGVKIGGLAFHRRQQRLLVQSSLDRSILNLEPFLLPKLVASYASELFGSAVRFELVEDLPPSVITAAWRHYRDRYAEAGWQKKL